MRSRSKLENPLSLDALAEGYCKSIWNAKRLIDDGEILIKCERYLGAINSFRLAIEEMAKAHLINQAAIFDEQESDKWKWFWTAFRRHAEKLKLLEYEFHWKSYKDKKEFNRRINLLVSTREKSIYVDFDPGSGRFWSPEERFMLAGDIRETAKLDFKDALLLFKRLIPAGMPSIDTTLNVFQFQRDEIKKTGLR
jgi:AbiV family abortive infection protein